MIAGETFHPSSESWMQYKLGSKEKNVNFLKELCIIQYEEITNTIVHQLGGFLTKMLSGQRLVERAWIVAPEFRAG